MHGIVSLFDPPMVLFYAVIQVHIRSVYNFISQRLAYCAWIGAMSVGGNRHSNVTNSRKSLLEELFGRFHVSLFTQPRIHQIAVRVNSSVEIAPLSPNFEIR